MSMLVDDVNLDTTEIFYCLFFTLQVLGAFLLVGGPLILLAEPCLDEDCVFKDSFSAGYFLTITL